MNARGHFSVIALLSVAILNAGAGLPALAADEADPQLPGCSDALFFQYRLVIRDLLDRRCNFIPSCSRYGQIAIRSHGPVFGTMIALERWTRCHSSAGGMDYYVRDRVSGKLEDPLETNESHGIWDSLLLPF